MKIEALERIDLNDIIIEHWSNGSVWLQYKDGEGVEISKEKFIGFMAKILGEAF